MGADALGVELVGPVVFGVQTPATPAHVPLVDVGVAQLDGEKRDKKQPQVKCVEVRDKPLDRGREALATLSSSHWSRAHRRYSTSLAGGGSQFRNDVAKQTFISLYIRS